MSFFIHCIRKFRWLGAVLIVLGILLIVLFVPSWLWLALVGVLLILLGILFYRLL